MIYLTVLFTLQLFIDRKVLIDKYAVWYFITKQLFSFKINVFYRCHYEK